MQFQLAFRGFVEVSCINDTTYKRHAVAGFDGVTMHVDPMIRSTGAHCDNPDCTDAIGISQSTSAANTLIRVALALAWTLW